MTLPAFWVARHFQPAQTRSECVDTNQESEHPLQARYDDWASSVGVNGARGCGLAVDEDSSSEGSCSGLGPCKI
jgi:hypothetical protein